MKVELTIRGRRLVMVQGGYSVQNGPAPPFSSPVSILSSLHP